MLIRNKTCNPISSSCVSYEAPFNKVLTENKLGCSPSIDNAFTILSKEIETLIDKVKTLDSNDASQNIKIIDITKELDSLKLKLNNLTASDIKVTIDLGCLTSTASPCEITPKTYSLLSILQLFKSEICLLK